MIPIKRETLINYINEKFGARVELLESGAVEPIFLIKNKDDLVAFCKEIKDDLKLQIDFLCAITAVDNTDNFEIIYSVASATKILRFDFKIVLDHDNPEFDSVIEVWAGANWFEREIWELYGINVKNHPNLSRFLLPDDWDQGNPMRRDWDAPDFKRMPDL